MPTRVDLLARTPVTPGSQVAAYRPGFETVDLFARTQITFGDEVAAYPSNLYAGPPAIVVVGLLGTESSEICGSASLALGLVTTDASNGEVVGDPALVLSAAVPAVSSGQAFGLVGAVVRITAPSGVATAAAVGTSSFRLLSTPFTAATGEQFSGFYSQFTVNLFGVGSSVAFGTARFTSGTPIPPEFHTTFHTGVVPVVVAQLDVDPMTKIHAYEVILALPLS